MFTDQCHILSDHPRLTLKKTTQVKLDKGTFYNALQESRSIMHSIDQRAKIYGACIQPIIANAL